MRTRPGRVPTKYARNNPRTRSADRFGAGCRTRRRIPRGPGFGAPLIATLLPLTRMKGTHLVARELAIPIGIRLIEEREVALVRSLQLGPADRAIAIGIEMPHHRAPVWAPVLAPHRTMGWEAGPTVPPWMPGKPAPHAPIPMPVRSVMVPSWRLSGRHRTPRARHSGRHSGRHHGCIARRHHRSALPTLWPRRLADSAEGWAGGCTGSGTGFSPGLGGRLRPRPRRQQGTGDARCQAQRPGRAR